MLLVGCVPPAEELAGVAEEPTMEEMPVEDAEPVEEKVIEEVQAPVEEPKQEVKNTTVDTTPAANASNSSAAQSSPQGTGSPPKEYFTGDAISIGEGETKIIVIDNP